MEATPALSFVMFGARDAMANGLAHIEEHVTGIERAVVDQPGLAFDLARTLVESTCRAVLKDRAIAFSQGDDLPHLFRIVVNSLPFLPLAASAEAELRSSLAQTLNGLHTAIQGICELRNQAGFASHGSGEPRPAMESVQALLVAEAADTIVGFLYRMHRQDRTAPSPRALYEGSAEFNVAIDDAHGIIRIFESEFRPSEVLYEMEPETYRVYLNEFVAEDGIESAGPESNA